MDTVLILISGKRKSGKDYISKLMEDRLSKLWKINIVGLSHSLKKEYAEIHGLDYDELLTSGEYKEKYRLDMIKWGEEMRKRDPSYFVRQALASSNGSQVIIVSDCRRISDLEATSNLKRILIRIESSLSTRISRGFIFTNGIDDAESECGLDQYNQWDTVVYNDNDKNTVDSSIEKITSIVQSLLL